MEKPSPGFELLKLIKLTLKEKPSFGVELLRLIWRLMGWGRLLILGEASRLSVRSDPVTGFSSLHSSVIR